MKLLSLLNPKILVLTLKTVLIVTWRVCWIVKCQVDYGVSNSLNDYLQNKVDVKYILGF